MQRTVKTSHTWLLFLILGIYASQADSYETAKLSEREIGALPAFCQVHVWIWGGEPVPPMLGRTAQQTSHEFEQWKQRLGWEAGYIHTHHYCFGLGSLNRYYRHLRDEDKIEYLNHAVADVTYTITKSPQNYILQPEMLCFRAKILMMLNKHTEAVNDLKQAIKLKPSYEKAYILLADIYRKYGQADTSKMILQHGLEQVPNSKALKKHLSGIDAPSVKH
jgi:tetratricopeptide (TPR) repeat protein